MYKSIDTSYTQNRELSWLRFNERVLEEAIDENVPLYERLKFIAIYGSNLDEFYRVRVGSLCDMASLETSGFDNKSFMTPSQQLDKIFVATKKLNQKADKIFTTVEKQLKTFGIERKKVKVLNKKDLAYIKAYFDNQISPFLSPQIINVRHPFPHLLNKVLYVGVMLTRKKRSVFGMIPVPNNVPKIVFIPNKSRIRYVMVEDIIATFADKIFDGYEIKSTATLSVTRSADISLDDERLDLGEDFLEHAREVLLKRQRLAPVRLEIEGTNVDNNMIKYAMKQFKITEKQIFVYKTPINKGYIFALGSKFNDEQKNNLMYPAFEPSHLCCVPENASVMDYVVDNDIMLQYPYQSFDIFLKFIKEAVTDNKVFAIKITLYRVGSHKAQLMNYLAMAAKMGKDVTVLMELRARFDEENNINWAEFLQDAGCKVIYGMEGYKVHSKICLVMKQEKTGIKYFTQIGTGNYNASTSALYTDISLITSNENIGKDAVEFFRNMGIDNLYGEYNNLLVAPVSLKNSMIELIEGEIEKANRGEETSIFLKMNSLTDRQLIDALKDASQAGVKIKMIIRGICCILPGIKGKTENIEVISVVGRFLEHSRVFCFGTGKDMKMYIASADWMTRNTENRVEIAAPIYDNKIKQSIYDTLCIMWKDNLKARILCSDGTYKKPEIKDGDELIDCQNYLRHEYKVGRKIKL